MSQFVGTFILSENNWLFDDLPNTMVLTTKEVLIDKKPILLVSHDSDDGMWQFHYGDDVDLESALLVSLNEIVDYDSSVTLIADLPLGWVAWRENLQENWNRNSNE